MVTNKTPERFTKITSYETLHALSGRLGICTRLKRDFALKFCGSSALQQSVSAFLASCLWSTLPLAIPRLSTTSFCSSVHIKNFSDQMPWLECFLCEFTVQSILDLACAFLIVPITAYSILAPSHRAPCRMRVLSRFNCPRTTFDSIDPFHRALIELYLTRMQVTGRPGINDKRTSCLADLQNNRMKFSGQATIDVMFS